MNQAKHETSNSLITQFLLPCIVTQFANCFKTKFLKKRCPGELLITKYSYSMIFPQFAVNNAFRSKERGGAARDVGSVSNLGAQHFEGTFSLRKRGHFLKMNRALLCLFQNLGDTCSQCIPVPTSMGEAPHYLVSEVGCNEAQS